MNGEDSSSHTNPEIGRSLERARKERGLSLWQAEEATKIRARYLHDLERENFDVLPAVYVLGSLKTYADYLGLDGEALTRELRNRQASLQAEQDPTYEEEPAKSERGGFPAFLGGLPGLRNTRMAEDEDDNEEAARPITLPGRGPSLYLGLGVILVFVLAVALASTLGGGIPPTVSQVRDPAVSEAPSRIAFSESARNERDTGGESAENPPEEQAESSDEGDEKDEKDQAKKSDQEDDDRPEETGDVATNLPAPSTASANTAPASASSTATASATSTPVAPADASSAATAPAPSARETAEPGAAPRPAAEPAVVRPAPDGSGQSGAGGLDKTRLADGIFSKVRSATAFAR